jgi:hypothetical protein
MESPKSSIEWQAINAFTHWYMCENILDHLPEFTALHVYMRNLFSSIGSGLQRDQKKKSIILLREKNIDQMSIVRGWITMTARAFIDKARADFPHFLSDVSLDNNVELCGYLAGLYEKHDHMTNSPFQKTGWKIIYKNAVLYETPVKEQYSEQKKTHQKDIMKNLTARTIMQEPAFTLENYIECINASNLPLTIQNNWIQTNILSKTPIKKMASYTW